MCLASKMLFLNCAACICPWGLTGHKMWQHAGTASLLASSVLYYSSTFDRGVFQFCRMSSQQYRLLYLGQALTILLCYRCGFPFKNPIFNATIFKGEQSTRLCWCQCFYNTGGFSWPGDTRKELGFTEIWRFPSESHPVGLSFGKNLCCLFATKLALLSLQRVFCSPAVWFRTSVVVIFGLAHLKLSFLQWELTKHRNLVTCSQYYWEEAMPYPSSMSEKTLVHPFISRKPALPVWVLAVLLKSFHCHANKPSRHRKQWTHPDEVSGCSTPLFIHIWSFVESFAQKIWG